MGRFASLKTEERRGSSHQERDGNRGMKVAGWRERREKTLRVVWKRDAASPRQHGREGARGTCAPSHLSSLF